MSTHWKLLPLCAALLSTTHCSSSDGGGITADGGTDGGTEGGVRPVIGIEPRTTNLFIDTIRQGAIDKIDLLFMLDNSRSLADKQTLLAAAVPDSVTSADQPALRRPVRHDSVTSADQPGR